MLFKVKNIKELILKSEEFVEYLVQKAISEKTKHLFFYKSENRIYLSKTFFIKNLETVLDEKRSENDLLEIIKKINNRCALKLGSRIFYEGFRNFCFNIIFNKKEEFYKADLTFILLNNSLGVKLKKLLSKNFVVGEIVSEESKHIVDLEGSEK